MASDARSKPRIPVDCHACHVRDMGICAALTENELDAIDTYRNDRRVITPGRDFLL